MNDQLMVLDPTAGVSMASVELVPRPASLKGLVVGYLDNGKPNSDRFLDLLGARLRAEGEHEVVRVRKSHMGRLAEPAVIEELAKACDVVITGVGDCAGCCSCTVQDGIALERLGRPTYVVCTTELVSTARIAAKVAGIPDYPLTVVQHPFGALTEALLNERVTDALQQINLAETR